MSALSDLLNTIDSRAAGAILLALVAAALSTLGWLALSVMDALTRRTARIASDQDKVRHLKEVLVDVLIDADFMNKSIADITDPERIKSIKTTIDRDPTFQAYVVSVHADPTFEDYRGIRRQLDIPLMAACDRYFDLSQLFTKYYNTLGEDAFGALDASRKKAVLDELCRIGKKTQVAHHNLRSEMERSSKSRPVFRQVITFLDAKLAEDPVSPDQSRADTSSSSKAEYHDQETLGIAQPKPTPPTPDPPKPRPPTPTLPRKA